MADYYPPVSFHFRVTFGGMSADAPDVRFQSVTGLEVQLETENVKEGGENRFEHVLPGRTKFSDLTLKRGVLPASKSAVAQWCRDAFERRKVKPMDLTVTLLNENHAPLLEWKIIHAWPKSWKFNELNAEKGEVFIETLELNYNRFEVKEP